MNAKEHEQVRHGQVQSLSVILAQVQTMRSKKRMKIEEYKYNIDILEALIMEDTEVIRFIDKLIAGKKDPSMNEQLEKLEEQINKVSGGK